jgi:hypothetical protein
MKKKSKKKQNLVPKETPPKTFVDLIAPPIIKFDRDIDYFICGNTYR